VLDTELDVIFDSRCLAARKMTPARSENPQVVEMFRQMHCSSYNTLSALLCATKCSPDDRKFYAGMLFSDNEQQVVWRNIVDSSKNYLPTPNYEEVKTKFCHEFLDFLLRYETIFLHSPRLD